MLLLASIHVSISFPAKYLGLGFSLVAALSTTFATTSAEEPFSNKGSKLEPFFSSFVNMENSDLEISWQQQ